MSQPFARRERLDLCDTALEVGPDADTLCGDWSARQLLAHLFVREHRPLAAAGIAVPPLAGVTEQAMDRAARRPFPELVDAVRSPGLTPFALKPVDVLVNTLEYLVHHEDLRRARPGWQPRELDPDDLDVVWRSLRLPGKGLVRPAGVPVSIRRSDTGDRVTLRGGEPSVTIAGPVVEVALYLYGRGEVSDVDLEGPDDLVAKVRGASFGA